MHTPRSEENVARKGTTRSLMDTVEKVEFNGAIPMLKLSELVFITNTSVIPLMSRYNRRQTINAIVTLQLGRMV